MFNLVLSRGSKSCFCVGRTFTKTNYAFFIYFPPLLSGKTFSNFSFQHEFPLGGRPTISSRDSSNLKKVLSSIGKANYLRDLVSTSSIDFDPKPDCLRFFLGPERIVLPRDESLINRPNLKLSGIQAAVTPIIPCVAPKKKKLLLHSVRAVEKRRHTQKQKHRWR